MKNEIRLKKLCMTQKTNINGMEKCEDLNQSIAY